MVSTRPIPVPGRILPPQAIERQLHSCSSFSESPKFTSALELDRCLWTLRSNFSLSELKYECGGKIITDPFAANVMQTVTTVEVPLYVAFVYYLPEQGLVSINQVIKMQFEMTYSTTLFGKQVMVEGGKYEAMSSPTAVGLDESDATLFFQFTTTTRFRGMLLPGYMDCARADLSPCFPDNSNALELWEESQDISMSNQFVQKWAFKTRYAQTDYSGVYRVVLRPCSIGYGRTLSDGPCTRIDQEIELFFPVTFSQVNSPIPAKFTLEAEFILVHDLSVLVAEKKHSRDQLDSLSSFTAANAGKYQADDDIMGRVSSTTFGKGLKLSIKRLYLCAATPPDLVVTYDPEQQMFGCLGQTTNYILIEGGRPMEDSKILAGSSITGNKRFDVRGKSDLCGDAERCPLGLEEDIFAFNAKPLASINPGARWYLQAVYVVDIVTQRRRRTTGEGVNIVPVSFSPNNNEKADPGLPSLPLTLQCSLRISNIDGSGQEGAKGALVVAVAGELGISADLVKVKGFAQGGKDSAVITIGVKSTRESKDELMQRMALMASPDEGGLLASLAAWDSMTFRNAEVELTRTPFVAQDLTIDVGGEISTGDEVWGSTTQPPPVGSSTGSGDSGDNLPVILAVVIGGAVLVIAIGASGNTRALIGNMWAYLVAMVETYLNKSKKSAEKGKFFSVAAMSDVSLDSGHDYDASSDGGSDRSLSSQSNESGSRLRGGLHGSQRETGKVEGADEIEEDDVHESAV